VVKLMDALNALLAKHKTRHQDIDEILLAGGSTRFARLRQELATVFVKKPIRDDVAATEAAAIGAALKASYLANFNKITQIYNHLRRMVDVKGTQLNPREIDQLLENDPVKIELILSALESLNASNHSRMDEHTIDMSKVEYENQQKKSLQELFEAVQADFDSSSARVKKASPSRASRSSVKTFSDLFSSIVEEQDSRLEEVQANRTSTTSTAKSQLYWHKTYREELSPQEIDQLEAKLWGEAEQMSFFGPSGASIRAVSLEQIQLPTASASHANSQVISPQSSAMTVNTLAAVQVSTENFAPSNSSTISVHSAPTSHDSLSTANRVQESTMTVHKATAVSVEEAHLPGSRPPSSPEARANSKQAPPLKNDSSSSSSDHEENKPEQTQQNAADKAAADKAAAENQAAALALIGKADQRIAQAKEDDVVVVYSASEQKKAADLLAKAKPRLGLAIEETTQKGKNKTGVKVVGVVANGYCRNQYFVY